MKDWKIKYKLYSLCAMLMVALAFTGILSVMLMKEVNEGTTIVSANWLPSVIIAEELNTATSDFRIAEASHVISQDNTTMLKHEQTIERVKTEINSMFTEYYTVLLTNATDKALIENAISLWEQYLAVHNEMITYSKNNDTTSAMAIMEGQSETLFNQVSSVFLQLVEFNKDGADQASLDGDDLYDSTRFIIIGILIFVIVTGSLFSNYIIKMIVNPMHEIENVASQMSKGVLSNAIHYESKDELGNLTNSMRDLCVMFQGMIGDLSYLLTNMADGNFTVKSQKPELYVGEFAPLITLTNHISEQLSHTLYQINEASNQVSIGSSQLANTAQMLAEGAMSQANSIGQLSQSLFDIEEQTKQNADNASLARKESEKSRVEIYNSSEKMKNMIASMNDISQKSSQIDKIIKVIDDIAFQTNILALNAAVEAARAGASGKGFAVVAGEVRNLAEKSAESAKNTAKLIDETILAVNTGTEIADETGKAIEDVVEIVQNVTDLVGKISVSSEEQKESMTQITDDVASISNVVNSNSASTEETAATSEELNVQSSLLKSLVGKFHYNKI